MSLDRRSLATQAARRALELRLQLEVSTDQPINVFDAAERLRLDLWFADIPSMEGIYRAGRRLIVLSSLRPVGRQAFTCAHEIGHDTFSDGQQFDELVESRTQARRIDPIEFRADSFAGQLLMPKSLVLEAFKERGTQPCVASPETFYTIACWLGVGYTTLVQHCCYALRIVPRHRTEALLRSRLPAIRRQLLGHAADAHLMVIDRLWRDRSADVEVGNYLLLPGDTVHEGRSLRLVERRTDSTLAEAVRPGIARVAVGDWSSYVRVSRRHYVGRAQFRFDEDDDFGD